MATKRNAAIGFIFITLLIDVIGFGIIIPVMPKLIEELGHATVSEASTIGGWLLFAFAITQFCFSPLIGGLSDRYGRRPVLLASLFGFAIDYLFLAFARNIAWLFIGRIVAGFTGASFTTAAAYIADISTPEERTKNFGMIGAAFGVGFIIGPLLGSLFGTFGTRAPFYAAATLSLVNFIYGYFVLPESLSKEKYRKFDWKRANPLGSLMQLSKQKVVINLILVMFILELASQAMPNVWSFFCIERFNWDEKQIGLSLAVVGIAIAIVQGGLIGWAKTKFGEKKSLFAGLLFNTVGFILFSFANQSWMMYAFLIPFALGGFAIPNIQSIITQKVPSNEQGELQGGLTSLISITAILGPLIMSNSFAYFTAPENNIYFPGIAFLIGAVLSIVGLIFSYFTLKNMR